MISCFINSLLWKHIYKVNIYTQVLYESTLKSQLFLHEFVTLKQDTDKKIVKSVLSKISLTKWLFNLYLVWQWHKLVPKQLSFLNLKTKCLNFICILIKKMPIWENDFYFFKKTNLFNFQVLQATWLVLQ